MSETKQIGVKEIVFLVIRKSLWGDENLSDRERETLRGWTDWRPVFEEMKAQTVHGLAEPLLDELNIEDKELCREWRLTCMREQMRWYQIAAAQQELLELLKANEIPCVIIKGTAAGIYYPNPVLRCPGDIDFLVKRVDFARAASLLEANGYTLEHDDNEGKHHHYAYVKNGVHFELHHRLGIVAADNEEHISMFERGIDARETGKTEAFAFPRLPSLLNGLCLLFHINQHLRSGLGLRQIIDWMCFARETLTDRIWNDRFRLYLQDIGMETFAVSVTAMCRQYLGLWNEPANPGNSDRSGSAAPTWAFSADASVCEELMEYILNKGNFGRKSGEEGHIASFWLDAKNPIRFFKRLQRGGMSHWKAAKKYKILRPCAWIYQIGHILRRLRKSRQNVNSVARLHQEGVTQRKLIEKLGLDVNRTIKE